MMPLITKLGLFSKGVHKLADDLHMDMRLVLLAMVLIMRCHPDGKMAASLVFEDEAVFKTLLAAAIAECGHAHNPENN